MKKMIYIDNEVIEKYQKNIFNTNTSRLWKKIKIKKLIILALLQQTIIVDQS